MLRREMRSRDPEGWVVHAGYDTVHPRASRHAEDGPLGGPDEELPNLPGAATLVCSHWHGRAASGAF